MIRTVLVDDEIDSIRVLQKLLDALENLDDVQVVYTNATIDQE